MAEATPPLPIEPSVPAVLAVIAGLVGLGVVLWLISGVVLRLVIGGAPRLWHGLARAGRQRPIRRLGMRLAERWPRLSRRVADRLAPGRITGLPLTLIAVAAAYLALLIGGVVEELMEADELQAVDRAILAVAVEPLRHPAVVRVFAWITRVGDTVTLVTAALVATGFLLARGPRAFVLPIGVTVLGAQVTTWGGKYLFDRSRPEFLYEVTAASPAFPSGHATGAAAVYGFIAYVLVRDLETAAARHAVGFWIAYGVALIAASRLLLNVHWPSDVAVGLLVGGFWLLAGISVAELLRARDDRSSNRARA